MEAVVQSARQYRQTMARYIRDQSRLLDQGEPMDELIQRNWGGFEETAQAEDALYDALDALDGYEVASSRET